MRLASLQAAPMKLRPNLLRGCQCGNLGRGRFGRILTGCWGLFLPTCLACFGSRFRWRGRIPWVRSRRGCRSGLEGPGRSWWGGSRRRGCSWLVSRGYLGDPLFLDCSDKRPRRGGWCCCNRGLEIDPILQCRGPGTSRFLSQYYSI